MKSELREKLTFHTPLSSRVSPGLMFTQSTEGQFSQRPDGIDALFLSRPLSITLPHSFTLPGEPVKLGGSRMGPEVEARALMHN